MPLMRSSLVSKHLVATRPLIWWYDGSLTQTGSSTVMVLNLLAAGHMYNPKNSKVWVFWVQRVCSTQHWGPWRWLAQQRDWSLMKSRLGTLYYQIIWQLLVGLTTDHTMLFRAWSWEATGNSQLVFTTPFINWEPHCLNTPAIRDTCERNQHKMGHLNEYYHTFNRWQERQRQAPCLFRHFSDRNKVPQTWVRNNVKAYWSLLSIHCVTNHNQFVYISQLEVNIMGQPP